MKRATDAFTSTLLCSSFRFDDLFSCQGYTVLPKKELHTNLQVSTLGCRSEGASEQVREDSHDVGSSNASIPSHSLSSARRETFSKMEVPSSCLVAHLFLYTTNLQKLISAMCMATARIGTQLTHGSLLAREREMSASISLKQSWQKGATRS